MGEGQLVLHRQGEKLVFRILKKGSRRAGQFVQGGIGSVPAVDHDPAAQIASEKMRTQAIGQTDQSGG